MPNDLVFVTIWWFFFFLLGVVSLPLVYLIFKDFSDLGYGLAKAAGLLAISYLAFILNFLKIIPLSYNFLLFVLFLYTLLNLYLFKRQKKGILPAIIQNLKIIIAQEALFTAGLILWTVVRGYQPDIRGLEKFMDFGFINSALNTKYLPPPDIWFAGKPINYYWFGHFVVAVATKLSKVPSSVSYNLMLATIMGLTLTSAFSLASSWVKKLNLQIDKRLIFLAGIISAILLTFGGNFHTPYFVWKNGIERYWYPDATRFIGYNPDVEDKTIHEFPIYSFIVSDLHAHLINLPFVLLFIGGLFAYALSLNKKNYSEIFSYKVLPVGFILGIMFMTSTWDFGNYFLATNVVLLTLAIKNHGISPRVLWIAGRIILIIVISLITALPFILNFESIAEGVKFVTSHSPLWQLAILWGFPAVLSIIFSVTLYLKRKSLETPDFFVVSLLITSWVLIILPEVIYVKDIYIASHYRANTMFKLTYQAFVMFYLSSGYITIRVLNFIKKGALRLASSLFFAFLFYLILMYPTIAVKSYYDGLKVYRGLAGDTWLKNYYPGEYAAYIWLKKNTQGQPVILEAPGDSYTDFNVISSYTGFPTVSGWFVHEWLWRGSADFPQQRVGDITLIYTSEDVNLTKSLLAKYRIEYVVVGTFERQRFPNINESKFRQIGKVIFSSGGTKIYQLN